MGNDDDCFVNYGGLAVRDFIDEMDRVWTPVGQGIIPSTSFQQQLFDGCLYSI